MTKPNTVAPNGDALSLFYGIPHHCYVVTMETLILILFSCMKKKERFIPHVIRELSLTVTSALFHNVSWFYLLLLFLSKEWESIVKKTPQLSYPATFCPTLIKSSKLATTHMQMRMLSISRSASRVRPVNVRAHTSYWSCSKVSLSMRLPIHANIFQSAKNI